MLTKLIFLVSLLCSTLALASGGGITREYLTRKGINPRAASKALDAYDHNYNVIRNYRYMTIVDFTLPSYVERMFVINTETGSIERYFVTHGKNSGEDWVERTSNELAIYRTGADFNSLRSATGTFVTDFVKMSAATGLSLTVRGLDYPGNADTFRRYIYIHGKDGVDLEWKRTHGFVVQSEGCFAVEREYVSHIIDEVRDGSLLYAYWDQGDLRANQRQYEGR